MSDERKVLLGMMRPPWHEVYALYNGNPGSKKMVDGACYINARSHQNQFVTMWQLGRFDTPVYATAQEIIDRVAEKIVEGMKA